MLANESSALPPSLTAAYIFVRARAVADPPASADRPSVARVDESASVSWAVAPTRSAAPAMRCDIARISDSVDAPSFPSATIADPSREIASGDCSSEESRTLTSFAMPVAASSAERSVVSPRSIIVFVNPTIASRFTPSWPAASATAAISSCVAGSDPAIPRRPSSTTASCSAVPSTVFVTPVNAACHDTACFAVYVMPARTAAPATVAT